jgi:hypothetical protein
MVTETSSTPGEQQQPYLRLATIDDLDKIVDSGFRAFLHDPVLNYFGNVKKVRRKTGPDPSFKSDKSNTNMLTSSDFRCI